MKRVVGLLFLVILISASLFGSEQVNVQINVQGNVFTLELFDANNFRLPQRVDLGSFRPGATDFPVEGSLVAACKSNTGFQWQIIAEGTPLVSQAKGIEMPEGSLLVRGLDPITSGGEQLLGNLITTARKLDIAPVVIYTSDNKGDLGFNKYEGTYVPIGIGVNIPDAQPAGDYTGTILVTLTE